MIDDDERWQRSNAVSDVKIQMLFDSLGNLHCLALLRVLQESNFGERSAVCKAKVGVEMIEVSDRSGTFLDLRTISNATFDLSDQKRRVE
jgi:hypothetical protein